MKHERPDAENGVASMHVWVNDRAAPLLSPPTPVEIGNSQLNSERTHSERDTGDQMNSTTAAFTEGSTAVTRQAKLY